ncbi:MAG: GNAT family N-acetyltransferase [Proteobacteria bacterium]|nr:GNAT family N-acetyltransferase [Pseudomonadota bacterium]
MKDGQANSLGDWEAAAPSNNDPRNHVRIQISLEPSLPAEEFRDILVASTLAERRPADDLARLEAMLRSADVIVTARDSGKLIGVSRAITDFAYCCYLSDLAVDVAYQKQGIGKRLIEETHKTAGELTTLILLAAPAAENYYPRIGMKHMPSCWAIPRQK